LIKPIAALHVLAKHFQGQRSWDCTSRAILYHTRDISTFGTIYVAQTMNNITIMPENGDNGAFFASNVIAANMSIGQSERRRVRGKAIRHASTNNSKSFAMQMQYRVVGRVKSVDVTYLSGLHAHKHQVQLFRQGASNFVLHEDVVAKPLLSTTSEPYQHAIATTGFRAERFDGIGGVCGDKAFIRRHVNTELPNFFATLVEFFDNPTQLKKRISISIITADIIQVVDKMNVKRQEGETMTGHDGAKKRVQEVRQRIIGLLPVKIKIGQIVACNNHE
jgi:hypothetical protein